MVSAELLAQNIPASTDPVPTRMAESPVLVKASTLARASYQLVWIWLFSIVLSIFWVLLIFFVVFAFSGERKPFRFIVAR
jgi:hypothetical protein